MNATFPLDAEYLDEKDIYRAFGKKVSRRICRELLTKGVIRSAQIGKKWMTTKKYFDEYVNSSFQEVELPLCEKLELTTTHDAAPVHLVKRNASAPLPLKKR